MQPKEASTRHDSEVWETARGWLFGCRTCLEHTLYDSQSRALARKQVHDVRALPWWIKRVSQPCATSNPQAHQPSVTNP